MLIVGALIMSKEDARLTQAWSRFCNARVQLIENAVRTGMSDQVMHDVFSSENAKEQLTQLIASVRTYVKTEDPHA